MNVNRKTLLKCILKYGNIRKLVDQKKRKTRFFIFFSEKISFLFIKKYSIFIGYQANNY